MPSPNGSGSGKSLGNSNPAGVPVASSYSGSVQVLGDRLLHTFRASSSSSPPPPLEFGTVLGMMADLDLVTAAAAAASNGDRKCEQWCHAVLFGVVQSVLALKGSGEGTKEKPWKDALAYWKGQRESCLEQHISRFRAVLSRCVFLAVRYHCWQALDLLVTQDTSVYGGSHFSTGRSVVDATFSYLRKNVPNFVSSSSSALTNVGGNVGGVLAGGVPGDEPANLSDCSDAPVCNFYAVVGRK